MRIQRTVGGAAIGLLLVAGCATQAKGPNLDRAVMAMPKASIRAEIAGHQGWGERLTAQELDSLAAYIEQVAGQSPALPAPTGGRAAQGLTLWRANACGSCHVLAAAAGASP